jgi:hypothetical protein
LLSRKIVVGRWPHSVLHLLSSGSRFTFTHARVLTQLAAKYHIAATYEASDPFVDIAEADRVIE